MLVLLGKRKNIEESAFIFFFPWDISGLHHQPLHPLPRHPQEDRARKNFGALRHGRKGGVRIPQGEIRGKTGKLILMGIGGIIKYFRSFKFFDTKEYRTLLQRVRRGIAKQGGQVLTSISHTLYTKGQ